MLTKLKEDNSHVYLAFQKLSQESEPLQIVKEWKYKWVIFISESQTVF